MKKIRDGRKENGKKNKRTNRAGIKARSKKELKRNLKKRMERRPRNLFVRILNQLQKIKLLYVFCDSNAVICMRRGIPVEEIGTIQVYFIKAVNMYRAEYSNNERKNELQNSAVDHEQMIASMSLLSLWSRRVYWVVESTESGASISILRFNDTMTP